MALSCTLAAALYWAQPRAPWQVTVVDVGQGLSVLVRQGDEGLLYDTGDAFPRITSYNVCYTKLLRFEGQLKGRILGVIPHAVLSGPDGRLSHWQTLEASQAVARLHGLSDDGVVYAQQNPAVIRNNFV